MKHQTGLAKPQEAIAVPAISRAETEMMAMSLTFQLRKRSPDVTRYRPLLSVHAYDEVATFQADKRPGWASRSLANRNPSHSHYLTSHDLPDHRARPGQLERPAGMTKRTAMRFGFVRRVLQVVRTTLVRPPGTRPVSEQEAREECQRQDQNRNHGSYSVFAPVVLSSPSCDDIMIPNAERIVIWKNRCADQRHLNDQFVFPPEGTACSRQAPKHEFQEDGAQ